MRGLGILILVVLFLWVVWPWIARWLKCKAMEKAEDYVRRSMGMPPHEKRKSSYDKQQPRERRNPFGPDRYGSGPIIPKEYAEDVEFTETIDYSSTETRTIRSDDTRVYHESQISDAEYTEIKKSRTK